jgi:putative ABC transport system substrate-binding protein
MRRRDFIAGLGGAAALPFAARGQQAMPVIAYLRSTSRTPFETLADAVRDGLKDTGFVEGKNVIIEFRYADNQISRLPDLAAELIRLRPAVITGNSLGARAAKILNTTIPIVFGAGSDPVQDGLVPNLNRPGGNITGITFFGGELGPKRLALLHQFVPKATSIAMLTQPNNHQTEIERTDVVAAAKSIGQQLMIFEVSSSADIERSMASAVERGAGAVLVGSGAFMNSQRSLLVALTKRHALPAIYFQREFAELGGLMSYGTNQTAAYRQVGVYAGRILKGEKPGDLPVMQATKFEFVINLKTAKTLGLEFHPQLLATADEVIE